MPPTDLSGIALGRVALTALVVCVRLFSGLDFIAYAMPPEKHLDIYVSPSGNDAWNGAVPEWNEAAGDGPMATPHAAMEKLRIAREAGHSVTVWLRGGVYRLDRPLEIGPEEGGSENVPVVWRAYIGETPVLDAGRKISGWQRLEKPIPGLPDKAFGHIWVAELSPAWDFMRLFMDGQSLPRSSGVSDDDWRSWPICSLGDNHDSEVVIPPGYLPPEGDGGSADLNFMPTPYTHWANTIVRVREIDRDAMKLVWGPLQLPRPDKTENIPFRIENIASGLNAPGRWYLDRRTGRLYLWPPSGTNPDDHEIVVPYLSEVITVIGDLDNNRPVRNLTLSGLELRYGREDYREEGMVNWDGRSSMIRLDGVEDTVIEKCRFHAFEGWALAGGPWLKRVTVRRSLITDGGGGGIRIHGRLSVDEPVCVDNVIEDNRIHDCGRVFWHSAGIRATRAAGTKIAHNLVHDMPYIGVSIGGGARHTYFRGWPRRFPELEALWQAHGRGEPTIDAVKRFVPGGNRIEKNIIFRVMRVLDDGAAIYCHAGHNDRISHNIVHDIAGRCVFGIYLDDEQMDSEISGNLVYNCPVDDAPDGISATVHLHHNGRNRVLNNVLVGGRQVLSSASGYGGHQIERNVFVFADRPNWNRFDPRPVEGPGDGRRQAGFSAGPSIVDRNIWWHIDGETAAEHLLQAWRRRGYGAESAVADPGFISSASVVNDGSPIYKFGFRPLEVEDAGPRGSEVTGIRQAQ